MGKIVEKFQNASVGKGFITHKRRDRRHVQKGLNRDQRLGQEIITVLSGKSNEAG